MNSSLNSGFSFRYVKHYHQIFAHSQSILMKSDLLPRPRPGPSIRKCLKSRHIQTLTKLHYFEETAKSCYQNPRPYYNYARVMSCTFAKNCNHQIFKRHYQTSIFNCTSTGPSNELNPSKVPNNENLSQLQPTEVLDVYQIAGDDPDLIKKLKVLFLEVDVWHQEGKRVPTPSVIKNDQWKELLHSTSRSGRSKYLAFLWGIEMKRQGEKRKKVEKQIQKENQLYEDNGHIRYGLNHNTIYMRVYETKINQHFNHNLIQAMQFGQKLVIDCGYDAHMSSREAQNAAKQITFSFSENRVHQEPFNLYLCNAQRSSCMMNQLERFVTTLYEDHFPLNVTSQSYLELFPKKNIVYLTPHCREELTTFDHDAIYVIGGIVDKVNQEPLSLAKAKKEGLQMAKLPLERYLSWGSGGGKSLTLNQMMLILLELKTSGDWNKALQHIPRRKLSYDEADYKARQLKQYRSKRDDFKNY